MDTVFCDGTVVGLTVSSAYNIHKQGVCLYNYMSVIICVTDVHSVNSVKLTYKGG
jgi:hypothetical protein